MIKISFRKSQMETLRRTSSRNFMEFLAMCGGLLGLFLGISILSVVELIYYFSIYLFCVIRRSRIVNVVIPAQQKTTNTISIETIEISSE